MAPCVIRAPFSSPVVSNRKCIPAARPRVGVVARAQDPDEADFEARVASLRTAKGSVPYGESRSESKTSEPSSSKKVEMDYSDEVTWLETSPSQVDLAFNVVMAATLVWIPLTASAVSRCAFVKYKITNKRIITITEAPWKKDESMVGFHEVGKVLGVSRGFGLYGDMVIYLKDQTKLEMRSVPDWQKVRDYILERKEAVQGKPFDPMNGPLPGKGKGFA